MRRRRLVPGLLALLAAGAAGAVALPTGGGGRPRPRPRLALPTPRSLARAVTVAGVLEHMAAVEMTSHFEECNTMRSSDLAQSGIPSNGNDTRWEPVGAA